MKSDGAKPAQKVFTEVAKAICGCPDAPFPACSRFPEYRHGTGIFRTSVPPLPGACGLHRSPTPGNRIGADDSPLPDGRRPKDKKQATPPCLTEVPPVFI